MMAFFAPFFLAGCALIAIPWLIHQIRRPEREPVRFSSLMFVPKIRKEVIERRRIQHLLLLLLRMAAFILLCLAFARPYFRRHSDAEARLGAARHLILMDTSFSMGAKGVMEEAKRRAGEILAHSPEAEQFGLISFDAAPKVLVGLNAPEESSQAHRRGISDSLSKISVGECSTSYIPALRFAQEQLLGADSDKSGHSPRLILHLISDFQKAGIAKEGEWRLSPRVEFDPVDVGHADLQNRSITDLAIKRVSDTTVRVQAKVKNWSVKDQSECAAKLVLGGETRAEKKFTLSVGDATQVAFDLAAPEADAFEGWVEISDDDLPIDNRRYFAWSLPAKREAQVISGAQTEGGYSPDWFISRAVPQEGDEAWSLTRRSPNQLKESLAQSTAKPEVLILPDFAGADSEVAEMLLNYVSAGGQLWLLLDTGALADRINGPLLDRVGIHCAGLRFPDPKEARAELLSWIDFNHPIFAPFAGARFNDFSQIRFNNHYRIVSESERSNSPAKVLAKFEADESGLENPAILEIPWDRGRILIWTFAADLSSGNFPKSVKFAPIVVETLNYLSGYSEDRTAWRVGDRYDRRHAAPGKIAGLKIAMPGEAPRELDPEAAARWDIPRFDHAGFFRLTPLDSAAGHEIIAAVNVDPAESDPSRISLDDFRLKFTSSQAGILGRNDSNPDENAPEGFEVTRHLWRLFIGVLGAALLLECWYAARLLR
ncbi:BatA domain-containing protein [Candidatus Sumerlaeota bacterium]|nr:BatA domain-containing protein [Candidatus Sumerlaeota bacterium]